MINPQNIITRVKPSIDRINITVPIRYYDSTTKYFDNTYLLTDTKYDGDYCNLNFVTQCGEVQITSLRFDIDRHHDYERFFINISDANDELQKMIKHDLSILIKNSYFSLNNALINQLEVAYDVYTKKESDLIDFEQYFLSHIAYKYARSNSYKIHPGGTMYFGRNGEINDGTFGGRNYPKDENGDKFYRIEFQHNRDNLLKNNITCENMPYYPLQFESFRCADFFDNITDFGIRNISRTILKNQGVSSSSKEFNTKYRPMFNSIKRKILGPSIGPIPKVYEQIESSKQIMKKYKLLFDAKKNLPSLSHVKELITCLAVIEWEEENCSKRVIFVCWTDSGR